MTQPHGLMPAVATLVLGAALFASAAQADPRFAAPSYRDAAPQRVADHRRPVSNERWDGHTWRGPVRHGPVVVVRPERTRHYRNVVVVRPYGHWYAGYGFYRADAEAYKWLGLTAITLGVLDRINESQERALEAAQIHATTAPVGQTIAWNDGGASGSVTALRDGHTTAGRYCREFQQTVSIGGGTEQAYGTACQQPDGAWEVVSTGG